MIGRELITAALRKLGANGANAVPTAEDTDVALQALNALLDSKSNTLLNIHTITPFVFQLVPGQYVYTLGPTGDWVTERPMRIEKANFAMGAVFPSVENALFLPIDIVPAEAFAGIKMRGVTNTIPQTMMDTGSFPDRTLFFWPVPSAPSVVELWLWEPLQILDLEAELSLPPGYERYLIYALALELSDEFGKTPSGEIVQSLIEAENLLRSLNQVTFQAQASAAAQNLSRGEVYNIIDFKAGSWMLPRKSV